MQCGFLMFGTTALPNRSFQESVDMPQQDRVRELKKLPHVSRRNSYVGESPWPNLIPASSSNTKRNS